MYMIYYMDPRDPSFIPKPLKPVSNEELCLKEIECEKLKAKTDDEKSLTYFYKEISELKNDGRRKRV
jgi:hypothetical protein